MATMRDRVSSDRLALRARAENRELEATLLTGRHRAAMGWLASEMRKLEAVCDRLLVFLDEEEGDQEIPV